MFIKVLNFNRMTKNQFKKIVSFAYHMYSYRTHGYFINWRNRIFSLWIRNYFYQCEQGLSLQRPAHLIGGKYITIGKNFSALKNLRLECWDHYGDQKFNPRLSIGDNVCMNYNIHIGCIDKVTIGNNVLFASNIYISDHFHGYVDYRDLGVPPALRPLSSKGPIVIEDNVWIGENVSIMPDVIIGENSIIGANSVVTKSFPSRSIIAGVPARLVRSI